MLVAKDHKKILLNLNEPERITAIIPGSKMVNIKGHDIVSVPHDLDTVRVLRNMGIQAPSPIRSYYDWPGRFTPFVHQYETGEFCSIYKRGYVLNDMGTGKTASVLWAFDYLKQLGVLDWALVISPLSTLERTWGDEIFRNFPEMSFGVVHGTADKRMRMAKDKYDVYIINHDGIKNKELLEQFARKPGVGLVIVDELGSFRNASTDKWKCANLLINGNSKMGIPPKDWVWGLTGTPTPNEPTDAWGQCKLITPWTVPKFFGAFRDATMKPISQYKWSARADALDTVHRVMQPAIRFKREDCIDLPPTTFMYRHVELTREQGKLYKEMLGKLKAEFAGGQITAANEAVKLGKLLQICCLKYDANVLTHRGWVEIQNVSPSDLVWDGHEWVAQNGAVFMGHKKVVDCAGVHLTDDHLVLSTDGWVTAKAFLHGYASNGLDWAPVRGPDGSETSGVLHGESENRTVGMSVHMRKHGRTPESVQVASGKGAVPVYDLLNCGPRNQFVVRGNDGQLRIVHNCGGMYGPDGEFVEIPSQPRIDAVLELIEQSAAKVIVFVPLTGALHKLADALDEHHKVARIHGGVSKNQRDTIFSEFMSPHGPDVLVAQPGTMSHGLTLTSADTVIWYGPINSAETMQQANARIVRPGQKRNTLIAMLEGSELERRMYSRLEKRESMQGTLLGMFE